MTKTTKTKGDRAPSADILEEAEADASAPPPQDKLDKITELMGELRDIEVALTDIEERRSKLSERKRQILEKDLVDAMDGAKVKNMTLDATGNLPSLKVECGAYYHANIAADWPEEKRKKSFAWIDRYHPGMLRSTITVSCGKGTRAQQKKIMALAAKLKMPASCEFGVPWNTLTAFVREQIEEEKRTPPLDLLGATVGRVVKIIKQKEK